MPGSKERFFLFWVKQNGTVPVYTWAQNGSRTVSSPSVNVQCIYVRLCSNHNSLLLLFCLDILRALSICTPKLLKVLRDLFLECLVNLINPFHSVLLTAQRTCWKVEKNHINWDIQYYENKNVLSYTITTSFCVNNNLFLNNNNNTIFSWIIIIQSINCPLVR